MKNKLEELTREDVKAIAPNAVVVIPVGAFEQHGPHLPLGTDFLKIDHFVKKAVKRTKNRNVLVTPTIPYGCSQHHLVYPGTMSLSGQTLLAILLDLGDSLVKAGFRRIFFLNGHGGNESITRQAVMEMTVRYDNLIVGTSMIWDIAKEGLAREFEKLGIKSTPRKHAGISETSMMLAYREDLVDQEAWQALKERDFSKQKDVLFPSLKKQAYLRRSRYMEAQGGLSESPEKASKEFGETLNDVVIEELANFLNNLLKHP